jgi:collagen type IV alpha-3-binding protein
MQIILPKKDNNMDTIETLELLSKNLTGPHAQLYSDIERIVKQQLQHALADVSNTNAGWELFVEDGDLKMYKFEQEIDGIVVDPLKALHSIDVSFIN